MILRLSLNIPEDRPYVTLARLLGKTTLEHMQVSPVNVGDVETILDELCSNVALLHKCEKGRFSDRMLAWLYLK